MFQIKFIKLTFLAYLSILLLNRANSLEPCAILYVDPKGSVVRVNSTFMVNVSIADAYKPGLYSYGFELHYDNTVLEGLKVTFPENHFLSTGSSEGIFTVYEINQSASYVFVGATLLGEDPGRVGNGTLATVTFEANSIGKCTLEIRNSELLTAMSGWWLEHIVRNGTVQVVSPEDLNLDGEINIKDLNLMGFAFGSHNGHPRWNPIADINKDEIINILDLILLARQFGKTL